MKTGDARIFLNKRKGRQQKSFSDNMHEKWPIKKGIPVNNTLDARRILEMKRKKNVLKPKQTPFFPVWSKHMAPSLDWKHLEKDSRAPGKLVKIAKDGNLWITSKSKQQLYTQPDGQTATYPLGMGITVTTGNKSMQSQLGKRNFENQLEELEEMTLDDLPDVKSLPYSRGTSTMPQQSQIMQPLSYFGNQVQPMKNTMVADYLSSSSMQQSYKILVTNLHTSVTKQDVVELFANIGVMKNAELLRPGTAVVEYFTRDDAVQACDTYHNRLLDGQPMYCSLDMNPLLNVTSISHRLGGRSLPVLKKPTSQITPVCTNTLQSSTSKTSHAYIRPVQSFPSGNIHRNVQFTVKIN